MITNERLWFIVITLIVLLLISGANENIYEYFTTLQTTSTMSNHDQRAYRVDGGFPDKIYAANRLSLLHEFIINYLRYVKKKFIINDNGHNKKLFFTRVLQNYNPDNIFENNPKPGEETSFVANKGELFGICLRKKEENSGQIHDMSILKFVMLHELTHLGCISYGHDAEFWTSFKMVLTEAVNSGLYTPIDYYTNPINYCGLNVTSNPYCDGFNKCL
jgi:hypothetical protein